MSQNRKTLTRDLLNRAREELQQESNRLNIQGRPLTDQEIRRVEKIGRAIDLINLASGELGGDDDTGSW